MHQIYWFKVKLTNHKWTQYDFYYDLYSSILGDIYKLIVFRFYERSLDINLERSKNLIVNVCL